MEVVRDPTDPFLNAIDEFNISKVEFVFSDEFLKNIKELNTKLYAVLLGQLKTNSKEIKDQLTKFIKASRVAEVALGGRLYFQNFNDVERHAIVEDLLITLFSSRTRIKFICEYDKYKMAFEESFDKLKAFLKTKGGQFTPTWHAKTPKHIHDTVSKMGDNFKLIVNYLSTNKPVPQQLLDWYNVWKTDLTTVAAESDLDPAVCIEVSKECHKFTELSGRFMNCRKCVLAFKPKWFKQNTTFIFCAFVSHGTNMFNNTHVVDEADVLAPLIYKVVKAALEL